MSVIVQENEHGNIDTSLNYFLRFKFKKNAKILDIGCNYGSLIYNLYKLGYNNIYGIDVNEERINIGKKKYKIINNRLKLYSGKKAPFSNNSFDVVLMFDVIEHIPNIQKFLKEEVYRILKKDGVFIFQTPNKYINIPWEIIKKKSLTKWKIDHCSLQTKKSLKRLLIQSNFRQILIEKNNIITKHNIKKIKEKIGFFGLLILKTLNKMPLTIYPNFWGSCRK